MATCNDGVSALIANDMLFEENEINLLQMEENGLMPRLAALCAAVYVSCIIPIKRLVKHYSRRSSRINQNSESLK